MEVIRRAQKVLDQLRPHLWADEGDVKIVKFENNVLYIAFEGKCRECPLSPGTLYSITVSLKEILPQIEEVVLIGDENDIK